MERGSGGEVDKQNQKLKFGILLRYTL
jgi:hypothetical protein